MSVVIGAIGVTGAMSVMAAAWYPIRIANDYMELTDAIRIPLHPGVVGQETVLTRSQAISCIKITTDRFQKSRTGEDIVLDGRETQIIDVVAAMLAKPRDEVETRYTAARRDSQSRSTPDLSCPVELDLYQASRMADALKATGGWHSTAGRAFYHHSYLMVPAVHLLQHGLGSPIPYLYGLGNTAFHALLIEGSPTVTRYFQTFPVARLFGILAIVLAACVITGSLVVAPIAAATVLTCLASIGYAPLFFAGGFSPLRYAGLALQLISIFVLFRGSGVGAWRIALCGLALAASLLWNREYGVIGALGQGLALLCARPSLRPDVRIAAVLGAAILGFGTYLWLGSLPRGFVENINVGIYGVPFLPMMDRAAFAGLSFAVIGLCGLGVAAAGRFKQPAERMPRLCMIPVLGLLAVKYIYCYSPIHLWYTLAFVMPASLAFFVWRDDASLRGPLRPVVPYRQQITSFAIVAITAVCMVSAVRYANGAGEHNALMIEPFQVHSWAQLDETFITTMPAQQIERRVDAIREELQPDDVVLFLSPFDHLLSFYVNPARYCGHFENVTNLVTYDIIRSVEECALGNPNTLVIYDEAVEQRCPTGVRKSYIDATQCQIKSTLLVDVQNVMTALEPDLQLVRKSGPLRFYRPRERR